MKITEAQYQTIREDSISGRYITNMKLEDFLAGFPPGLLKCFTGYSVEKRKIHQLTIGSGNIRVLMWSQMHGNESTTTKALLDLLNFFSKADELARKVLARCTITLVPILNPDGAAAYTRVNANKVDLNRDARERKEPESILLRKLYDKIAPDYCFNLHDQRTIFNVGKTSKPASVSFLAPAADAERTETASRIVSMQLIVAMNSLLQELIPGSVGRYDDSFNANCVGDAFQMNGTPTVLIEAGHTAGDYQRELTRKYVFFAILAGLEAISDQRLEDEQAIEYQSIPENDKLYFDILIHNADIICRDIKKGERAGIRYKEVLDTDKIVFVPYIESKGTLKNRFGHEFFDCKKEEHLEIIKSRKELHSLFY